MANEGFKGSEVLIEQMIISAGAGGVTTLQVRVQFASAEGDVHAVATHNFALDPEFATDGIAAAMAELTQLVTRKVESIHFQRPNNAETSTDLGIAESLRGALFPEEVDQG